MLLFSNAEVKRRVGEGGGKVVDGGGSWGKEWTRWRKKEEEKESAQSGEEE